jgi:TctA family transporter
MLETPGKTQAEVLLAFGYEIAAGGILQKALRNPLISNVFAGLRTFIS